MIDEAFWQTVRSALKGRQHGVMLSELSLLLESEEDTREHVYARLYARARFCSPKAGTSSIHNGLGFYRVSSSSYRMFLPEEPFVPPSPEEHQLERKIKRYADRKREMKGATGGLSRVPVSRASYEPPRLRVPVCRLCCNLPHARPESGCPRCGRPRLTEPKPVAPERCFNRLVTP